MHQIYKVLQKFWSKNLNRSDFHHIPIRLENIPGFSSWRNLHICFPLSWQVASYVANEQILCEIAPFSINRVRLLNKPSTKETRSSSVQQM